MVEYESEIPYRSTVCCLEISQVVNSNVKDAFIEKMFFLCLSKLAYDQVSIKDKKDKKNRNDVQY